MMTSTFIGLLRGINVGGRHKIAMPELRSACADLGWQGVQSYIQSGNLVFRTDAAPSSLEAELEQAIEHRFGLSIRVVVRPAERWTVYVRGNPYPDASQEEPNVVLLALSKAPPQRGAVEALQEAADGEFVTQVGEALWIHYRGGIGRSKLSPALLDRLVGSPVTARNWRTVLKLHEMTRLPSSNS